jgi:hypothetical protein
MAAEDIEQLTLEHGARQHAVEKVRAVEGADQLERVAQSKLRRDVASNLARAVAV